MPSYTDVDNSRCGSMVILSSVVLLFSLVCLVCVYVPLERTFYWWDYVNFQDCAKYACTLFSQSLTAGLKETWLSTEANYNLIFALPLCPFLMVFGTERLPFILSMTVVYLWPFILLLAAIATRIIKGPKAIIFISAAAIAFLLPLVSAPSLRGYPDTGAACLSCLALMLYLRDTHIKDWKTIVGMGFALGMIPLFRRHAVYEAIAFYCMLELQALYFWHQSGIKNKEALLNWLKLNIKLVMTAEVSLIVLASIGYNFLAPIFAINYHDLYRGFEVEPSILGAYVLSAFGYLMVAATACGLFLGIKSGILEEDAARPVFAFSLLSALIWTFWGKQLGVHYMLHFVFLSVFSLTALVWSVATILDGANRAFALLCLFTFLTVNWLVGLLPPELLQRAGFQPEILGMSQMPDRSSASFNRLFSANYGPLIRPDYDQLIKLTEFICRQANRGQFVYVASASSILNPSILINARSELYGERSINLIRHVAEVDSRDPNPLKRLLQADYVIVAEPFQHHLYANRQRVVEFVVDAFAQHWAIASDFVKLKEQFVLNKNVTVTVYKRIGKTSLATIMKTIQSMNPYLKRRFGNCADWVSAEGIYDNRWDDPSFPALKVNFANTPTIRMARYIYLDELPERFQISGNILDEASCNQVSLQFDLLDQQAKIIDSRRFTYEQGKSDQFSLSFDNSPQGAYLLLNLRISGPNSAPLKSLPQGSVTLSDLTISAR